MIDDWYTPQEPHASQAAPAAPEAHANDWVEPQQVTPVRLDNLAPGAKYSVSRKQWLDPSGVAYDATGKRVGEAAPGVDDWRVAQSQSSNRVGRVITELMQPIIGVGQLGAHLTGYGTETMDDAAKKFEAYGQKLKAEAGLTPQETDWYSTGALLGNPLNFVGGAAANTAAKGLPLVGRAAGTVAGQGALEGARLSAMQPVTDTRDGYWQNKGEQTAIGTAAGGVGAPVINKIGVLVKPAIDKAAQKLIGEGVRLTPGQTLGGVASSLESAAESYPVAGHFIRNARERSLQDFQVAAANRALAPINETVEKGVSAGPELVKHVRDKIGAVYDRVHPHTSLSMDAPLAQKLQTTLQDAAGGFLPDAEIKQLHRIIESQVLGKLSKSGGNASGELVQSMTSELGRVGKEYSIAAGPNMRYLGRYLNDVKSAVEDAIIRQNPQFAPDLKKAKKAWSLYKRLEDAAARQGGETGQFSPAQLERAAKAKESKFRQATGSAPMQDLAAAAKSVLPSKIPDSGTAIRSALYHILGGTGSHVAGHAALGPVALAPGLALSALYSAPGQALARRYLTGSPQSRQLVKDLLQRYAPRGGGAAALMAGND